MKFRYIGKEDESCGLKSGDIKDCGVATFVFEDHEDREHIMIAWDKVVNYPCDCKTYDSFRKLFEEWEEVYDN